MRAFVCKSFAGPDALRIGEIEKLQPAAGQVPVDVHAADGKEILSNAYPIMAANSIDDRWASPVSRDALMIGYKNALKSQSMRNRRKEWTKRNIRPGSFFYSKPDGVTEIFRN